MSDIKRTKERVDQTGEFFTPLDLVNEILDRFPEEVWEDSTQPWLDPTCGDGNFLIETKARLLKVGHTEEHILEEMIFGADIMPDNCTECILRLWGDGDIKELTENDIPPDMQTPGIISIFMHRKPGQEWKLVRNIVCANALIYNYSFGRPSDNPEGWDDIGLSL